MPGTSPTPGGHSPAVEATSSKGMFEAVQSALPLSPLVGVEMPTDLLCDEIRSPSNGLLSPKTFTSDDDDFIGYYDTDPETSLMNTNIFNTTSFAPRSNDPLLAMPLSEIPNDFDTLINAGPFREGPLSSKLTQRPSTTLQRGVDLEIYRPRTQLFAPLPLRTTMSSTDLSDTTSVLRPVCAPQTKIEEGASMTSSPYHSIVSADSTPREAPGAAPSGSPERMVASSRTTPQRPTPVTPEPIPDSSRILPSFAPQPSSIPIPIRQSQSASRYKDGQLLNWGQRYEEAKAFAQIHGHCIIPSGLPNNQGLARWAKRQRCEYQLFMKKVKGRRDRKLKSALSKERVELLNNICFCWNIKETTWMRSYQKLCEFHKEFKHTLVMRRDDRDLAAWVKNQRRQYSFMRKGERSSMTPERSEFLNKINFVWRVNRDRHFWAVAKPAAVVPEHKKG